MADNLDFGAFQTLDTSSQKSAIYSPGAQEAADQAFNYEDFDFSVAYSPESTFTTFAGEDNEDISSITQSNSSTPLGPDCGMDSKADSGARKRRRRRKLTDPVQIDRRRLQNRESQRAYRQRKDSRIKELEDACNSMKSENERLTREVELLRCTSQVFRELHMMQTQATQGNAAAQAWSGPALSSMFSSPPQDPTGWSPFQVSPLRLQDDWGVFAGQMASPDTGDHSEVKATYDSLRL